MNNSCKKFFRLIYIMLLAQQIPSLARGRGHGGHILEAEKTPKYQESLDSHLETSSLEVLNRPTHKTARINNGFKLNESLNNLPQTNGDATNKKRSSKFPSFYKKIKTGRSGFHKLDFRQGKTSKYKGQEHRTAQELKQQNIVFKNKKFKGKYWRWWKNNHLGWFYALFSQWFYDKYGYYPPIYYDFYQIYGYYPTRENIRELYITPYGDDYNLFIK